MKSEFIRKHYSPKRIALRIALSVFAVLVAATIVTFAFPGSLEDAVNAYPYSVTMLCGGLVVLVGCMEEWILRRQKNS